jgi:1-acylglycerone phosphate reductase
MVVLTFNIALEVDFDEVEDLFRVNVYAVMRMVQAFTEFLLPTQGKIVMIGSLSSVIPHVFGSAYNASKAALEQYSNTLRLELAPFGVKVIIIKTGGVQSRIARTKRTLPPGSLYEPITEDYQRRVVHSQEDAMPTAAYAKSVVKQVTVPSPKKHIWEGRATWIVWIIDTFFSKSYMVSCSVARTTDTLTANFARTTPS